MDIRRYDAEDRRLCQCILDKLDTYEIGPRTNKCLIWRQGRRRTDMISNPFLKCGKYNHRWEPVKLSYKQVAAISALGFLDAKKEVSHFCGRYCLRTKTPHFRIETGSMNKSRRSCTTVFKKVARKEQHEHSGSVKCFTGCMGKSKHHPVCFYNVGMV